MMKQSVPIAGLDLSLANTGIAIIDDGKVKTWSVGYSLKEPTEKEQLSRTIKIVSSVIKFLKENNVKSVAIEDYAFVNKNNSSSMTKLAELHGVMKTQIVIALKTVPLRFPILTIRKFLTGCGRADKQAIQKHLRLLGYEAANADEYDALAVALVLDEWANRTHESSWSGYQNKVMEQISKKRWMG